MEMLQEKLDGAYKFTFTVRHTTCPVCFRVGVFPPRPTRVAGVVYYCAGCGEFLGSEKAT